MIEFIEMEAVDEQWRGNTKAQQRVCVLGAQTKQSEVYLLVHRARFCEARHRNAPFK